MFNMKKSIVVVVVVVLFGMGVSVYVGNNDGGIVVSVSDGSEVLLFNVFIVIYNLNMGFCCLLISGGNGNFWFLQMLFEGMVQ